MARTQALADALERVLATPGPLTPFARELRSLVATERRASQLAARIVQGREAPPQRRVPSTAASPAPPADTRAERERRRRTGALREALGNDMVDSMASEAQEQAHSRRNEPGALLRERRAEWEGRATW